MKSKKGELKRQNVGLILPLLGMSVAVVQDDGQVAKQFYLNGKMLFEEERYAEAIIAWEILMKCKVKSR